MLQYLAHSLLLLWPFVLVPGKKKGKEKKKEDRNNQPPPSLLWTEMPRRPRLLRKGFGQLCKGLCCSREAPSQDWLCSTKPCTPEPPAQPPGAPGQEGPSPAWDPRLCLAPVSRVCVASSALTFQLCFITWMYPNRPHSMYTSIYCSNKKIKIVVYRSTTGIYVCVCVYTCKAVCVCMCVHG